MTGMCPLPLNCSDVYGELTVDGWTLHGPAWCAHDLSALYESPDFRDANVLVETEEGQIARPMVTDQTDYTLPMMFSGAVDRTGAAYTVPAGGLLANLRALEARLIDPIRSGTADLSATLTVPDPMDPNEDIVYTFDVQPLRLTWTLLPGGYARAVLNLRVPVPDFVVAGGGE